MNDKEDEKPQEEKKKRDYIKKSPNRVESICPRCRVKHISYARRVYCHTCKISDDIKPMPWDYL